MNSVMIENPTEREAMRYLEDQAYAALLGFKEPVRSAEIIGVIGKEKYSSKLMRHVLSASSRFAQIDRRWDLEIRYEDKQKPLERVLRGILAQYGHPMSVQQVANELASVYERPAEYYESMVLRMLTDEEKYFSTSDGSIGLREWLLVVMSDDEEDIIFDNDLDVEEINSLEKAAAKIDWAAEEAASSVIKFLDAIKSPVSNRLISFYGWRVQGEAFDPAALFDILINNTKLVWLSDQKWASKKMAGEYDDILVGLADKLSEEVLEEAPVSLDEKAEVVVEAAPTLSLNISDRDLEEVVQIISQTGEARMPAILESVFEISPRDPIYQVAAEGLGDAMRTDPRLIWVGTDRWRMADTIPAYASEIPAELAIPKLVFETADGERLDVELEDEGLEGGLDKEIHIPMAQDVGDSDPIPKKDEGTSPDSVHCVLMRHHKGLGTFPLCQIPRAFLPAGPAIIELTLVAGDKKNDVWVNRETGLIYDMGKLYAEDMPDSGAAFDLVKTDKPGELKFEYLGKTDPTVSVAPNRIQELLELAEEAKKNDLSTLDLMNRIMQDHRKGASFITLFTEVNIVRRTTRRLVASILSSYYAFYQRPKSALWHFDEKKVDQGFKKAKRKYVRKEK